MSLYLPLQDLHLRVECDQDCDRRPGRRGVGLLDHRMSTQLLTAQDRLDLGGFTPTSRRRALRSTALIWLSDNRAADAGSGALPSSSRVSGASRSSKASSAAGKYSRSA